ncbi:RraA family protein [Amycolatopsis pithecellobii]|uniref:RraA family protein n=1 Tax=Amycolatopsis pithecellobii TaxID=664692 RepID=UPI00140748FD|nr:RraA family protein [Amycolatopsis pithecellobii]
MQNADNDCPDALQRLSRFGTAAVSDALTELGLPDHMVSEGIPPIGPTHACAGVARTAQFGPDESGERDFGPLARFVDSTRTGDVLILAGLADRPGALWGDLCAAAAENRGASGVVLDGAARDLAELRDGDLPVFARGGFSQDALISSNIVEVDGEVTIGGLPIRAGQVVVADADGIIAFDGDLTNRVLELCTGSLEQEEVLRGLLSEGLSLHEAMSRVGTM